MNPFAWQLKGGAAVDLNSNTITRSEIARSFQLPAAAQDAARYMLRLRAVAKSYFGKPVLSEPAWNLMLALYALEGTAKACHIGSLSKRADIPRSTALRWLLNLNRSGFVGLTPDPKDKRAIRVRMTEAGRDAMQRSFVAARFAGT